MKILKFIIVFLVIQFFIVQLNAQNVNVDTISTANKNFETAKVFESEERYDSAVYYFEKASRLYEQKKIWKKFLQSETEKGFCHRKLKKTGNIEQIKFAIEKVLKYISENDTIIANAYQELAYFYFYKSDYYNTISNWEKSLKINLKEIGEKHFKIAKLNNNIGVVYRNMSKFDLAMKYFIKSNEIKKNLEGNYYAEIANTCENIGRTFYHKKDLDNALENYFEALELRKKLPEENNTGLIFTYQCIASIYIKKNELDTTIKYSLKLLELQKKILGSKHKDLIQTYDLIGETYLTKKNYDSTLFYFNKSLKIRKKKDIYGENHISVVNSYNNIAIVFEDMNKYNSALDFYKKALKVRKKLKSPKILNSYINIGNMYNNTAQYDSALQNFNKASEALKVYKKEIPKSDLKKSDIYLAIGNVYNFKSEHNKSLKYYFKSLKIRKKLLDKNHIDLATVYGNIGTVYRAKSEYDKALKYANKALFIRKENFIENHPHIANSYNNIAIIYSSQGNYEKSLENHFKALNIRKKIFNENNNFELSTSYHNIAIDYDLQGNYEKSLDYLFKSLNIKKKFLGTEHPDIADSYFSLSKAYNLKGDNKKSLEYISKALKIYKKFKNNSKIAMIYNGMALIYKSQKKYKKALKYHFKSLKIKKKIFKKNHISFSISYNNIALIYSDKKNYKKSLKYNFKAISILKNTFGEKHPEISSSYNNMFFVYLEQKNYEKAFECIQKAISSNVMNFNEITNIDKNPKIEKYKDGIQLLNSLNYKAYLYQKLFFENKEEKYSQKAISTYLSCDTLISKMRKNLLSTQDKIKFGEDNYMIYEASVKLCIELADIYSDNLEQSNKYKKLAFYFSEQNKASVLLESIASADALKFSGIPDTLLNLVRKFNIDIASYSNLKNIEEDDSIKNIWNDRLFKAKNSYDSLIKIFEKKYTKYYELKYNNTPVSLEEIQNKLNNKTVMLSYLTSEMDSTISIFAISKKDFLVTHFNLPDNFSNDIRDLRHFLSTAVKANARTLRPLIFDDGKFHYPEEAYNLYKLLFPSKVDSFLNDKNIENLIIIPDGKMATVPFEVFLTEEYKKVEDNKKFSELPYLLNKYNISYNYSATLFNNKKSKELSVNDLIAFAPVFNDEKTSGTTKTTRSILSLSKDKTKTRSFLFDGRYVNPLPGTEVEVDSIFNLYKKNGKKAMIKTHLHANENFVKSGELVKYKIIHFATHGFVNEEKPKFSGILFSQDTTVNTDNIYLEYSSKQQNEGILYQSEIYNLEFNAELVVLSACETGLGKITKSEGVIGLTRALLYAGSKNIIVSLWQVSDDGTKELMIKFYENLLKNEKEKFSIHLRKAKNVLIKDGKYAHPYFWSPFILIGE